LERRVFARNADDYRDSRAGKLVFPVEAIPRSLNVLNVRLGDLPTGGRPFLVLPALTLQLVKLTGWHTPAELVKMATSTNAELPSH
jgi:hypothetical protein